MMDQYIYDIKLEPYVEFNENASSITWKPFK